MFVLGTPWAQGLSDCTESRPGLSLTRAGYDSYDLGLYDEARDSIAKKRARRSVEPLAALHTYTGYIHN